MPHRTRDEGQDRQNSARSGPYSNTTSTTCSREVHPIESSDRDTIVESKWPKTWRAYVCWLACFFLMFNSWGLVNAYGTFSSYYLGHSLKSVDQLGLNIIGSTESFLVLLFSAPIGRLLDAGHYRFIIGTGTFLVPFGLFMLGVAHPTAEGASADFGSIWATQGLVVGLGMSCFFVSSSQIASTWFPRHRALAVGVVACGASIAGVVYPTILRYSIDAFGFNKAVYIVAGLVALSSLFSSVFATPNPAHHHPRPQSYRRLRTWVDPEAFRNKSFCWFTVAIALLFAGFYPVFFNLEEWAAISGFGTRDDKANGLMQTFWLLAITNGSSTVGRLFLSGFGDAIGALNLHFITTFICGILILTLWVLAKALPAAIAFCVFFGIFSGAVIGLPPASISNILECTYVEESNKHKAAAKLGQWTGMMYSIAAIPSLVGPIIAGHLISKYNTYITVQVWSGTMLILSVCCMCVSRWYLPLRNGDHARSIVQSKYRKSNELNTVEGLSRCTTMRAASSNTSGRVSNEKKEEQADEITSPSAPPVSGSDTRV